MNVLMFAGAGTSVELGVPSMIGMAEEFIEHSRQWSVSPSVVTRIMGDTCDIEHLIEELDKICSARKSLSSLGQNMDTLNEVDQVRAEVEWFLQHLAERVVPSDALLMWGSVLRRSEEHQLTIATTNYDRAIELAANGLDVQLNDGFAPFDSTEVSQWVGFDNAGIGIDLIKIHGSTDWYATDNGAAPVKLRHPMPLFGRAVLRLAGGTELESALVLPSREKLLTHAPYPRLSQRFLNAADDCDVAVFIGSSLRDQHVRGALDAMARKKPVYIVSPDAAKCSVEGARMVSECASRFLLATWPNAVASGSLVDALDAVSQSAVTVSDSVFSIIRIALDSDKGGEARCEALERLDDQGVTLDPFYLSRLLREEDARVARYVLGLVSISAAKAALLADTRDIPAATDPAFAEDIVLLRQLVAESKR